MPDLSASEKIFFYSCMQQRTCAKCVWCDQEQKTAVYAHTTVMAQGNSEPNGPCDRGAAIQSLITEFTVYLSLTVTKIRLSLSPNRSIPQTLTVDVKVKLTRATDLPKVPDGSYRRTTAA